MDIHYLNNQKAQIYLSQGENILLPMEDSAKEVKLTIGKYTWTASLAQNKVDYYIPYTAKNDVVLNIEGISFESEFYKYVNKGKPKKTFANPKPYIHFKPLYGWMNDPNGMFYKDGEWHLFYQYNPFGAKWGNMSWGHAVSKDLVNWKHKDIALVPDTLGMIFSGSAVVDKNNTAGFGKDAVIAIYTSAGAKQVQSIAYSNNDGCNFIKYKGNPVLTSSYPDFRDPKVLWHNDTKAWIMTISAGNAVEFYRSYDLKKWEFASRFGENAGNHGSVWECPDLFPLSYNGEEKWILLCSCNRDALTGSATQYFIGSFDGKEFIPDDISERWLDYGMDHYAAVSFSNAPENRKIIIAWQNNWMYGNDLPLKGWRGMMTTPRELSFMEYDGRTIISPMPVKEVTNKCQRFFRQYKISQNNPTLEIKGLLLSLDDNILMVERNAKTSFNKRFNASPTVKLDGREIHNILALIDDNSVELFIDEAIAMTFLIL